jgi:hypothetical protein
VNTQLPTVIRPPASPPLQLQLQRQFQQAVTLPSRTPRSLFTVISMFLTLESFTDCDFLGLEELVGGDLAPFAPSAFSRTASRAASHVPSRAASSSAATSTTKKKRGRPKGSKNKPRKKWNGEQPPEETELQVVEASASHYNTRSAKRRDSSRPTSTFEWATTSS